MKTMLPRPRRSSRKSRLQLWISHVVDENTEKRSSQSRPSMGKPVIKSVADATSENTLDEESGKGHGKPGMEAVMDDTSNICC
jgi:hypothetical protein